MSKNRKDDLKIGLVVKFDPSFDMLLARGWRDVSVEFHENIFIKTYGSLTGMITNINNDNNIVTVFFPEGNFDFFQTGFFDNFRVIV